MHVGLHVTNLAASTAFYATLFGVDPVKVKTNYTKFLLENPALHFTLRPVAKVEGNHINHFGFQVGSSHELNQHKQRLTESGLIDREENDTTCCYAKQDKFWLVDPDGHEWEFFLTKEDTKVDTVKHEETQSGDTCCTT